MTPIKSDRPFIFHFRGVGNKGGVTVVYVPEKKRWGVAICGKRDNFNRKLGRSIAQGRAECPADCKYRMLELNNLQSVEDVVQAARNLSGSFAKKHKIALTTS